MIILLQRGLTTQNQTLNKTKTYRETKLYLENLVKD